MMYSNLIILTGAMGSGKSTIIKRINERLIKTVTEPARIILAEQRSFNGNGTPEKDAKLFTELMLSRSLHFYNENKNSKDIVIFDRGIPDIIAYAELFDLDTNFAKRAADKYRYNQTVFFTEGWEEIYITDDERTMTYHQAKSFGEKTYDVYQSLGYTIVKVPHVLDKQRASFILDNIN